MNVKSVMVTHIKTIFVILASKIAYSEKHIFFKNRSTLKFLFLINRLKKGFSQSL